MKKDDLLYDDDWYFDISKSSHHDDDLLYDLEKRIEMRRQFIEIEESFINACRDGDLDSAKRLHENYPFHTSLGIREGLSGLSLSCYGEAFRWACEHGNLDVAQWLRSVNCHIDIHLNNHYAFRMACGNGHVDVALWLQSIDSGSNYHHLHIVNDKIVDFSVLCDSMYEKEGICHPDFKITKIGEYLKFLK